MQMQGNTKFSEWYQQRFNSISEQPPEEVWNNISKELDVDDVWNRVDSRLNRIDRRKTFARRTAYASLLFLLFFASGAVIFKTYNNTGNKMVIAGKESNRVAEGIISPGTYKSDRIERKFTKSPDNYTRETAAVLKSSSENSPVSSFSQPGKEFTAKRHRKNFTVPDNPANTDEPAIVSNINTSPNNNTEGFSAMPLPTLLVSVTAHDPMAPCSTALALTADSNFYSQTPVNNKFHGFYSGGTFALNNIWLLNQLALDGLKANSLNQTKIDFGYSYGILAGYNFNNHFGGELNWYINSQAGQTYSSYDEGKYENRHIRMDLSVISLALKYRNQSYSAWLNTPKSQNLLLGVNVDVLKRDRSSVPPNDNDDDIDIYENINTHFEHVSYGVMVGYEYEILAFHKIIMSSAIIGNLGLNNIFEGNGSIPDSFNRTHTASIGFKLAAKYLIK
jgi:hypothetical protein